MTPSDEELPDSDKFSGTGRREECNQELSLMCRAGGLPSPRGKVLAGAADELTSVDLRHLQNAGDLGVGVVEGFAQHIGGSFGRREPLQQEQDPELQLFDLYSPRCGVDA